MARVTLKTLAAHVGVSPATVSNAYNRPEQLSADLRRRILATADALGYTGPDAAGRALRRGRADAVGVLLCDRLSYAFSDPFSIEFLAGLTETLEQHVISVVLMPLSHPGSEGEEPDVTAVAKANIDALSILSLMPDHPAVLLAKARGLRLVHTDIVDDPAASWVAIDEDLGGRLIGGHLAELGHRRAVVVTDTNRPAGSPAYALDAADVRALDYAARIRGLESALPEGITLLSGGHNASASGASVANWLVEQPELPTAVACLSDVIALGLMQRLAEHGVAVPAEVSVTGFDDIAAARSAGLTTVRQPMREKGREVGRLLADPDAQPRHIRLPIELVVRSSAAAPRSR